LWNLLTVRCRPDEIDAFRSIKNPTISGRVNISTVHLELSGTIHDCKLIAEIESFEMQKNCKKIKSEHA
jgi:hypothetical protein